MFVNTMIEYNKKLYDYIYKPKPAKFQFKKFKNIL